MSFRSLFRGVLTGGLVGFIGGVLFAPKKGEETRKELNEKKEELSHWWNDFSDNLKQKKEELFEKMGSHAGDPNEKGM